MTDAVGRTVYNANFANEMKIQVSSLNRGVYYVQLINANGYKNVQELLIQ